MQRIFTLLIAVLVAAPLMATPAAVGGDAIASLKAGKPALQSAGVIAFGPDGILLVGDSKSAKIFALDTGDRSSSMGKVDVAGINAKIAGMLGTAPDQILINDMVVNPISKNVYMSVSRGRGPDATPVIVSVNSAGKISELDLANIKHSSADIPNPVGNEAKDRRGNSMRMQAVTDVGYLDGKVFVAGLSNEEFASNLRVLDFPFNGVSDGTSVEIFHGNHGRWETRSPVRTFLPYEIMAEPHLLAAYTCTPLVKFPVKDLKPGTKLVGTTIAELGNHNRPLDMIKYTKDGSHHVLMSNSARGVMKMSTKGLENFEAITEPLADAAIAGLPYETIKELEGVTQLDKLDDTHAVILVAKAEGGPVDLKTIALP